MHQSTSVWGPSTKWLPSPHSYPCPWLHLANECRTHLLTLLKLYLLGKPTTSLYILCIPYCCYWIYPPAFIKGLKGSPPTSAPNSTLRVFSGTSHMQLFSLFLFYDFNIEVRFPFKISLSHTHTPYAHILCQLPPHFLVLFGAVCLIMNFYSGCFLLPSIILLSTGLTFSLNPQTLLLSWLQVLSMFSNLFSYITSSLSVV